MTWGFVAIAGATVVSGAMGASAAKSAANTQAQSAADANAAQLQMYNQNREDQTPYREAGYGALGQVNAGIQPGGDFNRDFTLADFRQDPGYQFRMQQGQQALERSAAARGGALGGATLKAISRYGQDYGSQEYSNAYNRFNNDRTTRFNRLATVAGIGQTANNTTAQLGAQTAANIGQNTLAAGNAAAAGQVGAANAWTNTAQTLGNYYMQNQWLNGMNPKTKPSAVAKATGAGTPGYSTAGYA